MPPFERLTPRTIRSHTFASVATDSSSYAPFHRQPSAGQVVAARFMNATAGSATSGTTAGSAIAVNLYKNASSAGSLIATFSGSGTAVSTLASVTMATSGTTNARLAAGDLLIAEFVGGVANDQSNAGCYVEVDIVYGYETGTNPSAATGPA